MKHRILPVLMALMVMAVAVPALAQNTQVKGVIKGPDGKPMPDVQIVMHNKTSGQTIKLKSDKKGEFFSLGVTSGPYDIDFLKDGKSIWKLTNFAITLSKDINEINVDLQKEAADPNNKPQMTEEQKKEQEAAVKDNEVIKNLNVLLAQANTAKEAGNLDEAIGIYGRATQADPSRPLLWALLGNAKLTAGKKETDSAAKKEKFESANGDYKKAIDLANASADPKVKASLGGYYNNYAETLARTGKAPEAVTAYESAAAADPANAAMYYFNEGATMTNAGKADEAIAAYDKAIAADPTRADAYYLKGIALLGKATMKGDKMVPVPGTSEAFNKYLELAPDGKDAENAKQMLAAIGATVQTNYGTKTKKK